MSGKQAYPHPHSVTYVNSTDKPRAESSAPSADGQLLGKVTYGNSVVRR